MPLCKCWGTPFEIMRWPEYILIFYIIGIVSAYAYNRIMVNVSQGTMRKLRTELFQRMESLPASYFDTHSHGDIMSVYTNDVDILRQLLSQSTPSSSTPPRP